jgi:RNA polymerase sigma-70 factor (ECF subfamily)
LGVSNEFADFCEAHHDRLVGSLGLYLGDRAVAEELAQEALARAWARWTKVRELDDPPAWLYRVAWNLANSHFRRKLVERRAQGRIELEPQDDRVVDLATALTLRQAVAQLPRRKRTALVLRYFVDMPYAEIAKVMDAPESTVKSLARRAIEDLRGQLPLDVQKEPGYVC